MQYCFWITLRQRLTPVLEVSRPVLVSRPVSRPASLVLVSFLVSSPLVLVLVLVSNLLVSDFSAETSPRPANKITIIIFTVAHVQTTFLRHIGHTNYSDMQFIFISSAYCTNAYFNLTKHWHSFSIRTHSTHMNHQWWVLWRKILWSFLLKLNIEVENKRKKGRYKERKNKASNKDRKKNR